MSTILEALKKSEKERKLNAVPTLSDMPVPQESSRWPLIVIAILSLVLALMIGLLLGPWFSAPQADSMAPVDSQNELQGKEPVDTNVLPPSDIIVNVVSYSENPKQRFVILDGKMFRENDFVRTGLRVEEIKPSAVVLNLRGESITRTP